MVMFALACLLPAQALAEVSLVGGDATGKPGDSVQVTVTLDFAEADAPVFSVSNDLTFTTSAPIARNAQGRPVCTANPEIGSPLTGFQFIPRNCTAETCTGVSAVIGAPDGGFLAPVVLYTCTVAISSSAAAGEYEIGVVNGVRSNESGTQEFPVPGTPGVVTVALDTPTPTHTPIPTSTHTPILPTRTNTPLSTNTPLPTSTRTVTPTFPPSAADDGCQMGSGDSSNALLALLLPAAAAVLLRRRTR